MKWDYVQRDSDVLEQKLSIELNIDQILAGLLVNRKIHDFESARSFFRPSFSSLHDPFLMKGMLLAVERIVYALKKKQKILVYGDYDVDGVCATSMVYDFFSNFSKEIRYYLPNRHKEGYGLSYTGIEYAIENEIQLLICVDCGIRAIEQVKFAKTHGIDTIICDHHEPSKILPEAIAILNPKQKDCHYPYEELCGCGVGFKLLQAIVQKESLDEQLLENVLDLVAVSTAADIVPLTGENRILMQLGIRILENTKRIGFQKMVENKKEGPLKHFIYCIPNSSTAKLCWKIR